MYVLLWLKIWPARGSVMHSAFALPPSTAVAGPALLWRVCLVLGLAGSCHCSVSTYAAECYDMHGPSTQGVWLQMKAQGVQPPQPCSGLSRAMTPFWASCAELIRSKADGMMACAKAAIRQRRTAIFQPQNDPRSLACFLSK